MTNCTVLVVSPSVGQADNAWHHFVGDFYFRFNGAAIMRDAGSSTVFQTEARRIRWIDQSDASCRPFGQDWKVVHPAIISVELTASYDHKFVRGTLKIGSWPLEVVNEHGWRESDLS